VREPELVPRIRLVVMGGCFFTPRDEWNIKCDPEAAAIVVESGVDVSFIGLDVTLRCTLNAEQIEAVGAAQPALKELMALWCNDTQGTMYLHDPLALATLWSDAVRFEDKCVRVELCGEERGWTKIVDGAPNARVAIEVDAGRAVADFMQRMAN
jgi:inosine-uridine nucleoside N-ribohydrolase